MDLLDRFLTDRIPVNCHWQAGRLSGFKWCRSKDRRTSVRPTTFILSRRFHGCEGMPRDYRTLCQALNLQSEKVGLQTSNGSDVGAVLFDMDGVLCNSEELSRNVGALVMKELFGIEVQPDEFIPFVGMGEAYFLGGVARKYAVDFTIDQLKDKFFALYLAKAKEPGVNIGYKGARELVVACRKAGLKVAVASSADRVKVDANLLAAGFDAANDFDAIVSADLFEKLKPAPDIFLAAAKELGVPPQNCLVIEDAPAGVQAARAAGMRVVGVTTTLSEEGMRNEGPDLVRPDISEIRLSDITGARYTNRGPAGADPSGSAKADGSGEARAAGSPTPPQTLASSPAPANFWYEDVQLPGGYRTTRRDLLKFGALGGVAASGYVLLTRAKAMSFASPKGLLNALLPRASPPSSEEGSVSREAAFRRYIADLERRGGGEQVPQFPTGLQWFNAPPLRLDRELKGKLVLLDFWTYCCINCIHVLPDLAFLERKYAGKPVVVVGVHSAKFDNEKDSEAIRNAVLRYEISHPVVNDAKMVMWRELGVSSWPTLALLSPSGKLIAMLAGEGHRQDLDDLIGAALDYYGEKGELDASPIPSTPEREKDARLAASPLRFPGKIASDIPGNRLFISDSNNNRIVVTDLKGKFLEEVGGNGAGLKDGSFQDSAFNRPQGVAFSPEKNVLYVADTENHALREIDLTSKRVRTLAGNGRKGQDYVGGGAGASQQLNSPWDVVIDPQGGAVYIAMAGQHQIWRHDIRTGATAVFSGDGYERNQNGRSGVSTSWAQPSGLALAADRRQLWVADSESSTIRSMSLSSGGSSAHVGGDAMFADNLFRFGDREGSGTDALLQHPLAVSVGEDGLVYVADSYNHKIKVLDPSRDSLATVAGSGTAGFADGAGLGARLSEPGGLAPAGPSSLFIADTNNSVIRVLDIPTKEVRTLDLRNVPSPRVAPGAAFGDTPDQDVSPGAILVVSDPIQAEAGEVELDIQLPSGYHYTEGAPSRWEVTSQSEGLTLEPPRGTLRESGGPAAVLRFFPLGPCKD
eukprot:jgi/Botrbrau1/15698/Bobra.4_1s0071.2